MLHFACYLMLRRYRSKTRLEIHPHACDWGIIIWHIGDIIVNDDARIGKNFTIYPGCLIGHKTKGEVPIIGDNCFMGAGSKVIGKVKIGNNVTIAPNAVVVHDVPDNCIVGGIPARVIKYKDKK